MNILILSAGTRNKIVQYFKEAIGDTGRVIATDCSDLAPALYDADGFHIVPRMTEPGYIDCILDICSREKVKGVFSLIDPELSLLAREKERFLAVGTIPIISPAEIVDICFDKYQTYELLTKMGIPTGACYLDKEVFYQAEAAGAIQYPVFVKPVKGSASMNINKVSSREEVELLFSLYEDLMIQEYMNGTEYGADVYVDMISGKCTSVFVKEKVKMRAGETDKAISYVNQELFKMLADFAESCGFCGMIDIDLFLINGRFHISEINPRFGGGYPHAYACGVNMPAQVMENLAGRTNPIRVGDYQAGVRMMKYNEIKITIQ